MKRNLSEKQERLAEAKARGLTDWEACKEAGYKSKTNQAASQTVRRMFTNEHFLAYIETIRDKSRTESVATAQDVKEGLTRMMLLAEAKEDFSGFTALANRLAKMDGHDEPERHKLEFEVNIGGSTEG